MVREANKLLTLSYIEHGSSLVWSFCLAETALHHRTSSHRDAQGQPDTDLTAVHSRATSRWDPADLFWKLLRPVADGGNPWPKLSDIETATILHAVGLRALVMFFTMATWSNESGDDIEDQSPPRTTGSTSPYACLQLGRSLPRLAEPFLFRAPTDFLSWYMAAIRDEDSLAATTWSWRSGLLNPDIRGSEHFAAHPHQPWARTTFTVVRHFRDADTLNLTSPVINDPVEDFRFVIKLASRTGITAAHIQSAVAPYMPPISLQGLLTPYGFIMSSDSAAGASTWLWIWPCRPSDNE